jgi:hypothetical protein
MEQVWVVFRFRIPVSITAEYYDDDGSSSVAVASDVSVGHLPNIGKPTCTSHGPQLRVDRSIRPVVGNNIV